MLAVLGLVVGSGLLDGHSASAIEVAYLEPGHAVRVSDGPVNFRDGAGLDAPVLDVVAEGALFEVRGGPVYADGYAWVNVFNYGTGTGWVAADFLSYEPNGFPGDGQGGVGFEVGTAVRVVDGPLNLRDGAGLGARILDVVPEGELFVVREGAVTADGYLWVKVFNYGYGTGWMATDFLAVDPDGFPGDGQ
jgi:uncharacterized protein YraI